MNEFSEEERHLITLSARKRTGFTQKPDIIQILSYFIFLWNIISQILVSFPALTYLAVQLSLTALVMGSSIALGVCAVSVAVTDPTDEHVVITKYLAASKNEIY